MLDLFGERHDEPDEYTSYMASARWAQKRAWKLEAVGHRCEKCGQSKYSGVLDVHHLTYDRLGHERLEDLQVLCKQCHEGADIDRWQRERDEKAGSSLYVGFVAWAEKTARQDWTIITSEYANRLRKEYLRYMKRVTHKAYCLDLTILGKSDQTPEWRP